MSQERGDRPCGWAKTASGTASRVSAGRRLRAHRARRDGIAPSVGEALRRRQVNLEPAFARAGPRANRVCQRREARDRRRARPACARCSCTGWRACGRVQPSPIRWPSSASSSSRMAATSGAGQRCRGTAIGSPSLSSSSRCQPEIVEELVVGGGPNRAAEPGRRAGRPACARWRTRVVSGAAVAARSRDPSPGLRSRSGRPTRGSAVRTPSRGR